MGSVRAAPSRGAFKAGSTSTHHSAGPSNGAGCTAARMPGDRVMWVASTPHFCGAEDCEREGQYEIRLEQGESVWAKQVERDSMLQALEAWQGGLGPPEEEWDS